MEPFLYEPAEYRVYDSHEYEIGKYSRNWITVTCLNKIESKI